MSPAHAGMNRPLASRSLTWANVTRTRGDEPMQSLQCLHLFRCHPHTRG